MSDGITEARRGTYFGKTPYIECIFCGGFHRVDEFRVLQVGCETAMKEECEKTVKKDS